MQAGNEDIQRDLQYFRLTYELSAVDSRLAGIQARKNSLQGVIDNKEKRAARKQLADLQREYNALNVQRSHIQQAIDNLAPVPQIAAALDPQSKTSTKKGCLGKIGRIMVWLLIYLVLAGIIDAFIGDPVITPAIITVAIFWYFRRRRNRMAIQSQ